MNECGAQSLGVGFAACVLCCDDLRRPVLFDDRRMVNRDVRGTAFEVSHGIAPRRHDLLNELVGSDVPAIIPWIISYLNSMTVVGLLFGSSYRLLPGRHGITKGFLAGVLVWLVMGSVFFPLVGLGFFAWDVGLGLRPTLFSLTMVQAYSTVMGKVFAVLNREC